MFLSNEKSISDLHTYYGCLISWFFLFRCRKSGWPLCGAKCEKKVKHNPEVVVPHQTGKYTEFPQNPLIHRWPTSLYLSARYFLNSIFFLKWLSTFTFFQTHTFVKLWLLKKFSQPLLPKANKGHLHFLFRGTICNRWLQYPKLLVWMYWSDESSFYAKVCSKEIQQSKYTKIVTMFPWWGPP